ncbi:MAG: hypothetical protein ABSH28_19940 [Acidobacteriota bacterium]
MTKRIVSVTKKIFSASQNILSKIETIFSVTKNMFSASQNILSKVATIFSVTKNMVSASQTILSKVATIFSFTKNMVSAIKEIFSLAKTVVSLTNTMEWRTPTMVSEVKIMVTATQKMLSVAFAMFFAAEQIASAQTPWSIQHRLRPLKFGSPLSKQSFANPKLVSFWSSSPLASELRREIHRGNRASLGGRLIGRGPFYWNRSTTLHPICALKSLSSIF